MRGQCWFLDSEPLLWGIHELQKEIYSSLLPSFYGEGEILAGSTLGEEVAKLDILGKQVCMPKEPLLPALPDPFLQCFRSSCPHCIFLLKVHFILFSILSIPS